MKTRTVSRRAFLQSSAALGGALVISFWLPRGGRAFAQGAQPKAVNPNAFLRIGKDGSCTVFVKHLEFGQGVTTSLPMLVAEELDCDWSRVRAELAPAGADYAHTAFGMQMTGGSSSVWNSYDQLRTVGAQARAMLMQAAASQWKVKVSEVRTERGFVLGPGGKRLDYGALAEAAGKLPVPEKVALKEAKDFKVIGKPTRRIDSAEKVNGKAQFGLDVKRPNLHTALIVHPPVFGARVVKFDAAKVQGLSGVTHVVQISNGVAVVGKSYWAAKQGRDALQVEWDLGANAGNSSEALFQRFREMAKTPGLVARKSADAGALKASAKTIVAEYEVPFLAHAPMEPLNCTVEVRAGGAEIWVGSQFQTVDQAAAAKVLGLQPAQVKLNTMLAGGGFGRRANPVSDYVIEACEVAREVKVPVKVVWTREDDIRGGYYRPMYAHRIEAGVDAQGAITGWNHAIVGPSIVAGTPFEPMMVKDGIDPTSTEGVSDMPYDIPNLQVMLHTADAGVPVLWWRSVGHSHTGFVVETMIDDLAAASGKDPVAFGLSAALFGEVTLKDGRVQQSNFHDYRVLRMDEMPRVEVHLVPGGAKPTGVGEPGTPPIAPAVANALFALTGKRARKLPLSTMKWA